MSHMTVSVRLKSPLQFDNLSASRDYALVAGTGWVLIFMERRFPGSIQLLDTRAVINGDGSKVADLL